MSVRHRQFPLAWTGMRPHYAPIMHRRHFLQQVTAGAAGLAIGSRLSACSPTQESSRSSNQPRITPKADRLADRMADRMAWWREARFGMFIHFGLYSMLGGEWKGKRAGSHEWIRNNYRIPHEDYKKLVHDFNPVGLSADDWVLAAKNAGHKYLVLTTKHHEGFSLFDSSVTTYDVAATPFKRDLVREIADACRRHDMRIGWYYSIMDWYHADYLPRRTWEKRDATGADFARYVTFMKAQLKELLTNYGDISVLWFDGQWESTWTHALGLSLYDYCRTIAPNVIINDRVDVGTPKDVATNPAYHHAGDFTTPEQKVPDTGLQGVDWESCVTMNDNWGYSKFDHHYKSVPALVHLLVETASRGGNLLLNVGPMGDGRFPPESLERLQGIGAWMRVNGSAIYGSRATPFAKAPVRVTTQDKRLNLFIDKWPTAPLRLPALSASPRRAFLLEDPAAPVSFTTSASALSVSLPARAPASLCPVVVLEFDEQPQVNGG